MTKSRHLIAPRTPWSAKDLAKLRAEYPTSPTAALALELRRSETAVYQRAKIEGLAKDAAFFAATCRARTQTPAARGHRFAPGHTPWNAGKKGWSPPGCEVSQFRKGNRPQTWVPVGTYRIEAKNHYLQLKVRDDGPPQYHFECVHRLVWTQACGPIPRGSVVGFQRGRFSNVLENITLDALELVTRAELMRRNSVHTIYGPELARIVQLRGAIKRQINKRSRAHAEQN